MTIVGYAHVVSSESQKQWSAFLYDDVKKDIVVAAFTIFP
jgi:hypothetical protein